MIYILAGKHADFKRVSDSLGTKKHMLITKSVKELDKNDTVIVVGKYWLNNVWSHCYGTDGIIPPSDVTIIHFDSLAAKMLLRSL